MNIKEFNTAITGRLNHASVTIQTYQLRYAQGTYDFLKIVSNDIRPGDKIMLLRAGIHGDETSGPLTFFNHIDATVRDIHSAGLKTIIYPLGNPSGFEHGLRYNIDNDKGEAGNGDFVRYELADGRIVDDLGSSNEYAQWYWSSDPKFNISLPLETRLMHTLLRQDFLSAVAVAYDIHQDYITLNAPPTAYHYAFGDLNIYNSIIQKIEKVVPILKNTPIGAGFHVAITEQGVVSQNIPEHELIKADDKGFIVRHDGSLPDLMYRIGTPYCITSETMGSTPIEEAIKVNLCWIEGLTELARKSK